MTYHNQRPQCPSLSPHVLLLELNFGCQNGQVESNLILTSRKFSDVRQRANFAATNNSIH